MVYVALLRGINVGGKAKVEMPRLKALFEQAGCTQVATYINSGNVLFSDDRSPKELVPLLEKAMAREFNLGIPLVLRDLDSIRTLCEEIPLEWTNDSEQKTDVLFLWEAIDSPDIMHKVVINPELENVRYIDGALVWSIARQHVTRGNEVKLVKTGFYKYMTIRNINTVRRLYKLMSAVRP